MLRVSPVLPSTPYSAGQSSLNIEFNYSRAKTGSDRGKEGSKIQERNRAEATSSVCQPGVEQYIGTQA